MDNRDIFNFDFVDRLNQQKALTNFISSSDNFLWIDGESGIGKSFLIQKKLLETSKSKKFLYINLAAESENNCINELIEQLQDFSNINFMDFIIENYSAVFNIAKKTLLELANQKSSGVKWFFEILFDSNLIFFLKIRKKQLV